MRLGLISDTHGYLPMQVFKIFKNVDFIFHAGDIGNPAIIDELQMICPVYAVYGNIDTWPIVADHPRVLSKEIDSTHIFMIHDIVAKKNINFELFKKKISPDIIIFGHTHITEYEVFQDRTFINPGSSSMPKKNCRGTVAILEIEGGSYQIEFVEISAERLND